MKEFKLPLQKDYPKHIYAGSARYEVIFKNIEEFGITDFEKKQVILKNNMSERQLFYTFIHELLHVIEEEDGIDITHKLVYQLERAIGDLLLDNFL